MMLSIFLTSAAGVVVGATVGRIKCNRSASGACLGGLAGLMLSILLAQGPCGVMAVESPDQFETNVLGASKPVLVVFYADWCPPCRRLKPTIEQLSEEYSGRIDFVKVNVDRAGPMASSYEIKSTPTVMVFVGGRVVHKWTGDRPAEQYRQALDKLVEPK